MGALREGWRSMQEDGGVGGEQEIKKMDKR